MSLWLLPSDFSLAQAEDGKASLTNAPEENVLLVLVPKSGAAAEPKSEKSSAVEE